MKRTLAPILMVLALAATANAHYCQWGQPLLDAYDAADDVAQAASTARIAKQVEIITHMAAHGCNDPYVCQTLWILTQQLSALISAEYTAFANRAAAWDDFMYHIYHGSTGDGCPHCADEYDGPWYG